MDWPFLAMVVLAVQVDHHDQNVVESEVYAVHIKVVSFDAEGTLASHEFSRTVWHEAIPALYAEKNGIGLAEAERVVFAEYDRIGDQKLEWYDIDYWFGHFELGPCRPAIQGCESRLYYYPEVREVLSALAARYRLIVCSGTPVELLQPLLRGIGSHFVRAFSAPSHYRRLKTPDFYRWVCSEMSVQPDEVVHIGDNWEFDFLNSRQAGMHAFHLDRSGSNHESIADLTQVIPCLLSS